MEKIFILKTIKIIKKKFKEFFFFKNIFYNKVFNYKKKNIKNIKYFIIKNIFYNNKYFWKNNFNQKIIFIYMLYNFNNKNYFLLLKILANYNKKTLWLQ